MFENLPIDEEPFDLILADPPWKYNAFPARGNADNHYNTVTHEDLKTMRVAELAGKNAVLLMWTTGLKMEEAMELIRAWGFQYRGVFCTWVKMTKDNKKPAISCGYYTRSGSEFVLLAVRGKATELRRNGAKDVRQVLFAPRTRHSAKPPDVHRMADRVFPGAVRKLELFARKPVDGWRVWGNEV